ncbi:hypothetical protein [Streptomyces sp. SUK 48]|uniref:hypothetical protein n=1 Tax=Streptomyces sp. SUK 48 TaxID=2582831 RepID=UPI00129AA160|nr:hypothetical protein [Streptomyces sp. SUK 48]
MTNDNLDHALAKLAERRRHAADLEQIVSHYQLEARFGIRVEIGGRVRRHGKKGTIVDTSRTGRLTRLKVLFDGTQYAVLCHVTASMEYETPTGWVLAAPVPVHCTF